MCSLYSVHTRASVIGGRKLCRPETAWPLVMITVFSAWSRHSGVHQWLALFSFSAQGSCVLEADASNHGVACCRDLRWRCPCSRR